MNSNAVINTAKFKCIFVHQSVTEQVKIDKSLTVKSYNTLVNVMFAYNLTMKAESAYTGMWKTVDKVSK